MKITYLGTAAAEGMPAVWCNCTTCVQARKSGGKNIRTRSQVLFNNDLLLDFPMDTYMHTLTYGLDLSAVQSILITHAHMDHCYPQELLLHGAPYAHNLTNPVITVYGNETVLRTVREHNKAEQRAEIARTVQLRPIKPFTRFTAGRYEILALPARHTQGEDCLVYVVRQGDKSIFLFNDSGILPDSVYDYMADQNIHLQAISFDCTYGIARHGEGRHMGALDNLDELQKMRARGIADADTLCIVTHFSHNGGLLHEEIESAAKGLGLIAAYDGFTLTL